MKKGIKLSTIIILLSFIFTQILGMSANVKANTKLRVNARSAIALDKESGTVLYEQNAYEIVPMASTTKILTSLIAIEQGSLDKKVTISKKAASVRGSTVGYKENEEITLKELIFGLMFKSGNDAAIAIAEELGTSTEGFAEIMNHYARGIGIL